MKSPSEYPRRVLLAVSGLTPQIVTETLYALATGPGERFVPTEVHLLTTTEGADRAKLLLLSKEPGWFARLCKDYKLDGIQFPEENIHVLCNRRGELLKDIRTEEDNQCAADAITEFVRQLTDDPESAVHVSLAGGRKTMGFYIAYALSLFGREQDRLSHVLAHQDFEEARDFFYPTKYEQVITSKTGKPLDTRDATVTLASIPYVNMRQGLPKSLLRGVSGYSEVVGAASAAMAPAELTIDLRGGRVRAAGRIIDVPRAQIAMLSVFARRAMKGEEALAAPPKSYGNKEVGDIEWSNRYYAELRKCVDHVDDLNDQARKVLKKGMDGDYFSMQLTRLHKALQDELGVLAAPYMIDKVKHRSEKDSGKDRPEGYRMKLNPKAICYGPLPKPENTPENSGRALFLPALATPKTASGAAGKSSKAGARSRGK
jgi:CRISPR-associated protein (TIGR02584 family)